MVFVFCVSFVLVVCVFVFIFNGVVSVIDVILFDDGVVNINLIKNFNFVLNI